MRRQFQTRAEVDAYLAHEKIECLECGQRFAFLGNHLRRVHGISADEYRIAWGLPATVPLAGTAYRAAHAEKIRRMQAEGTLTYDHLPAAVEAARHAGRTPKSEMDARAQSERVAQLRPVDAHRLPPGARRADGKNADRVREYQRAYRARLAGDELPMIEYMRKWRG